MLAAERDTDVTKFGENSQVLQALEHFPTNITEFVYQQRQVEFHERMFELAGLGIEAQEGYWAERRLQGEMHEPTFVKGEDIPEDKKPNVIWLGGLMTWRGIGEIGRSYSEITPMAIKGPYASVFENLKRRGAKVTAIFPKSGVNTPDAIEDNVARAAEAIHEASESSDGPIEVAGHSMGVAEEFLLAAKYPDQARKVNHFFMGGFPLPVWLNSWVKGYFVAFRGGKEFKAPEELIDFLTSPESSEVKLKMISWINIRDRIVRGPTPDKIEVKRIENGHSAIFYSKQVLDDMWSTTVSDMRLPTTQENSPAGVI